MARTRGTQACGRPGQGLAPAGRQIGRAFQRPRPDPVGDLALGAKRGQERPGARFGDLDIGFRVLNADRADRGLLKIGGTAQKRQDPARLRPLRAADGQGEPAAWPEGRLVAGRRAVGRQKLLRGGVARLVQPQEGRRDRLGAAAGQQAPGKGGLLLAHRFVPAGIGHQPLLVLAQDVLGRGRYGPFRRDLRPAQKPFGLLHQLWRDDQRRYALAPGAAGTARPVQQAFGIGRQVGMDHQRQVRQVDAARRDIGRDADAGTPVTHRLQRVIAFRLAQFARQGHDRQAAIGKPRGQVVDRRAGVGKDDGALILVIAQQVEDRVVGVRRGHPKRPVGDVGMLFGRIDRADALRIALILLGQLRDHRRNGGRKHQRPPLCRGGGQHEFQILAEAEVQHLVGLVEDDGHQRAKIQRPAFDVVAQAPRRADDDMRPAFQRAPFLPDVHAAHAGGDDRAGAGIKPPQFAHHLERQFARRRDDKGQRRGGGAKGRGLAQKRRRDGKAEAHCLARTGLRRNQQVRALKPGRDHRLLDRGKIDIATLGERLGEGGDHGGGFHG